MSQSPMHTHIRNTILIAASAGVLSFCGSLPDFISSAQSAAPDTGVRAPSPAGQPISLKGEMVCLKRRDTTGPQLMSCAIGFRDDEDRFYGLRDSDAGYRNLTGVPSNARVRLTGIFTPRVDREYRSVGTIEITRIVPADDLKQAVGEYVCLPHADPSAPRTEECMFGIKTRGGLYWGLDTSELEPTNALSQISSGDQVVVAGRIARIEPEDWAPWQKYPIEGVLAVTSLKRSATR